MAQPSRPRIAVLGTFPPIRGGIATNLHHLLESPLKSQFRLLPFQTMSRRQGTVEYFRETAAKKTLRVFSDLVRFVAWMARHNPNAVHINSSFGVYSFWRDAAYLALCKCMKKSVLLQFQGGKADAFIGSQPAWLRPIGIRLLKMADRLAVCSDVQKKAFHPFQLEDRVLVMPNMVGENPYLEKQPAAYRSEFHIPQKATVVLFVSAQFHRAKGVGELLDAVETLSRRRIPVLTVMAGGGSADGDILDRIHREEQNGRVLLTGHLDLEPLQRLYASADLFVLPSYSEGLPLSVLEAMAAALPVVATPVGGIPDAVENGFNGYLIPVKDGDKLADRIQLLVKNRSRRSQMGRRGLVKFRNVFETSVVAERYGQIFRSLQSSQDGR
jgi:glycosyltransferase involved in cell wall biosynthesis